EGDDLGAERARVGEAEVQDVRVVEPVDVAPPVVAAEGAAGQLVLESVVEDAEARARLPPAVTPDVPGRAQARGELVSPSERARVRDLDPVDLGLVGGQKLVLEADPQVQGQA